MCGPIALPWLLLERIDTCILPFIKLFLPFGIFYGHLVCTITRMSAVPFVVINCSSSFSAEKAENDGIAA